MATIDMQLSDLSENQLRRILQHRIGGIEMALFIYDAAGEQLLSSSAKEKQGTSQEGQISENVQHAAHVALGQAPSLPQPDSRCLTELVCYRGGVLGVLVGWIGTPTVEPQMRSLWGAMIQNIRDRIEDLLNSQEEMNALSEEILDTYRELGLIHNLSTQLAGLADNERVYQVTLEQTIEIVEGDRGYILELQKPTGNLHAVQCFPDTMNVDELKPIPVGEGLIGVVAKTGDSILIEDVGHPIWSAVPNPLLTPPLMCCALQIGQEILGVIAVARDSTGAVFTAGDLKILESAALQSASAMKGVALLHDLRQSNRELRNTLEELQRTQAQLIQSQRIAAIGQIVAGVAHDLNNPLTSVNGFAEILRRRATDEKQQKYLDLIRQEAQRAANIVRGLLTFSRQHPLKMAPLNVNQIVQSVIQLRTQQPKTRRVEFSTHLTTDPPTIMADFHQLQQVLFNLILNAEQAILHAKGQGAIEIITQRVASDRPNVPEQLQIIVKDNGPGIPPEIGEKIFDPFFTTKKEGKGTGLGLSICMRIINAHGGTIRFESQVGEGTRFFILLPSSPAGDGPQQLKAEQQIQAARPANILVVDDEAPICEMLRDGLEEVGYHVETASNGREALEKVHSKTYDLVLTDVYMPDLNGAVLYQKLQKEPNFQGKFILMTGSLTSSQVPLDSIPKTVPRVLKPFELEEITRKIQSALKPS